MMNTKFKIGTRVAVEPMDDEEATEGAMDGAIIEINVDLDGTFYLVQLDNPLPSMLDIPNFTPPATVDAHESELTTLDK